MMLHPITITLSTGRCGTFFLASTFQQVARERFPQAWVTHEHLRQDVTRPGTLHRAYTLEELGSLERSEVHTLLQIWLERSEQAPVVDFGWTMRPLASYLRLTAPERLRVIHLHRHPVSVAASFALIGSYSDFHSANWAITPDHPRAAYPRFAIRWAGMSAFEKCLFLWLEVNAAAREWSERYPDIPFATFGSRDLFSSPSELGRLSDFIGFGGNPPRASTNRNPVERFNLERRPIRDEWERYDRHPEVIELAKQLGYDMSREHVASIIRSYQLPPGILPWLRNRSGYWRFKSLLGHLLRSIGIRS